MFRCSTGRAGQRGRRQDQRVRSAAGPVIAASRPSAHSAAAAAPPALRCHDHADHAVRLAQTAAGSVQIGERGPHVAPGVPGGPRRRARHSHASDVEVERPLGEPGRQIGRHRRIAGRLHVQHGPPAGLRRRRTMPAQVSQAASGRRGAGTSSYPVLTVAGAWCSRAPPYRSLPGPPAHRPPRHMHGTSPVSLAPLSRDRRANTRCPAQLAPPRCRGAPFCYDLHGRERALRPPVRFASARPREHPGKSRWRYLARNGDEAPPCMRWRGLAYAPPPWQPIARQPRAAWRSPAALASRLLRCRVLRGATGVRFPPSAPVARPFHRSLGFPWGGSRLQW